MGENWYLWVERFASYMQKKNFSERTVKDYSCQLRFFFQYLAGQKIEQISQVTKEVLSEYRNYLYYYERKGRKLSFDTQRSKLTTVKSFFRYLSKEDYLPYDPSSGLELPKRKKLLPRGIMSARQMEKVLEIPEDGNPLNLRDKAILEILYGTGIRNSEIRSISIFDIDVANQQLRLRGKGKKERIVPLGECASYYAGRYLAEGRPKLSNDPACILLFVSKNGKKITSANLIWIVRKYVKKAKLSKEITPHSFRHTCASHMLKGKADLRHIQEMLGHSSVETTQIYTKVELSNLKEVHRRCHPRKKMGFTR